jgi:hypothetical protein
VSKKPESVGNKEEELKKRQCRSEGCAKKWVKSTEWVNCENCGAYRLCPSCKKVDVELFNRHVRACKKAGKGKAKRAPL